MKMIGGKINVQQWLDDFNLAGEILDTKAAQVRELQRRHGASSVAGHVSKGIKQDVASVLESLEMLSQDLDTLKARATLYKISKEEIKQRRENLVKRRSEANRLNDLINGRSTAQLEEGSTSGENRLLSPPRETSAASRETEEYLRKILKEQDAGLDRLDQQVGVVHSTALGISDETEEQAVLIDSIGSNVAQSNEVINRKREQAEKLIKANRTCYLWCTILVLSIILIALVAAKAS